MNSNSMNHVDLICLSSGNNLQTNSLHAETVAFSSYKLFYIYRGSCVVNVNGTSHLVETDCSIMIFPFQKYEIEQADSLKFFWIEFSGFAAAAFVSQLDFTVTSPTVGRLNKEDFELLFDYPDCSTNAAYEKYRNGAVILLMLSFYLEMFPGKYRKENRYVYSAKLYIEANFNNPELNVNTVVKHLKIDRSYFYRLFKNETGMSPVDYINRQRISRAELLLSDIRMSIKDVAFSVGYTDQMYFSRVFKRLNGHTPTQFRKYMYT